MTPPSTTTVVLTPAQMDDLAQRAADRLLTDIAMNTNGARTRMREILADLVTVPRTRVPSTQS